MAKLVAVCRETNFQYKERQIPLAIEEGLTMVMEMPSPLEMADTPIVCVDEKEVDRFKERFKHLTADELASALTVNKKDLFLLLSSSVQCVGCRRSAERLYNQLWKSKQQNALEPLMFLESGCLAFERSCQSSPKFVHGLLYVYSFKVKDLVVSIPTSKRNRRCWLHSLETHKSKASGLNLGNNSTLQIRDSDSLSESKRWMDAWDVLSQECRDEMVLIDSDALMTTLEGYLRKHRFCSECKSKVLRAFGILSGDIDGDTEKGYCPSLYDGLKSCPQENHIHVICDTDYIAHLIGRAEPELVGGRRERHARTIDVAQEEVLTCLGIHLWERLHRLWQKMRAEEQTWQILFFYCVEALRKSFEVSVENKLGITRLEEVVKEFSEADRLKEVRREQKRLKKKRRKENRCKCRHEEENPESSPEPTVVHDSESNCPLVTTECNHSQTESETSSSPTLNDNESNLSCNCSSSGECSEESEKLKLIDDEICSCDEEKSPKRKSCSSDNQVIWNRDCDKENKRFKKGCGIDSSLNDIESRKCPKKKKEKCFTETNVSDSCECSSPVDENAKAKNKRKQTKMKEKQMKYKNGQAVSMLTVCSQPNDGDDEELRFLKSMGWTCPDSTALESTFITKGEPFIPEHEIEDFKAKKKVVENQRQQLRERLRLQFQNLSVGVQAVSVGQR